jgi:hypothetical protein
MLEGEEKITYFARSNFHNKGRLFGIKKADRRYHMYLIGRTGMGKSTLLETLVREDIAAGEGFALFDPHGDSVERVFRSLPKGREAVYLNLPDPRLGISFNPLAAVPKNKHPLVTANLVEIFKKTWSDAWGNRMEHVLRNTFLALLEYPGASFADIPRLYTDKTSASPWCRGLPIRRCAPSGRMSTTAILRTCGPR